MLTVKIDHRGNRKWEFGRKKSLIVTQWILYNCGSIILEFKRSKRTFHRKPLFLSGMNFFPSLLYVLLDFSFSVLRFLGFDSFFPLLNPKQIRMNKFVIRFILMTSFYLITHQWSKMVQSAITFLLFGDSSRGRAQLTNLGFFFSESESSDELSELLSDWGGQFSRISGTCWVPDKSDLIPVMVLYISSFFSPALTWLISLS